MHVVIKLYNLHEEIVCLEVVLDDGMVRDIVDNCVWARQTAGFNIQVVNTVALIISHHDVHGNVIVASYLIRLRA